MNGPFDHASPEERTADRLRLHANGYHPVPANGKRPIMDAWQNVCQTAGPEEIAGWANEKPDHLNTGILCGTIVGIDIDVVDEMLSARLVDRALEVFGHSPLRRIGRAPKTLLVYRVVTPIAKLQTSALLFGNDPNTKAEADKCKVEILAEGQHFVALGIHPDTRLPYRWPEKTPLDVAVADVPLVSVEALEQFVDEAEAVLRAAGARTAREIKGKSQRGKFGKKTRDRQQRSGKIHAGLFPDEKPSREVISDALNHIPNDMDWEDWYRMGYALYDGLGDAGRDLWEAWSAKSPKNDSRTTSEYWPRFAGGVGKEGAGVTIGTLLWHAKENGWKGGAGWITLNDLHAYLPHHSYIYTPTGDLWPAVTVNSQLPSMPVFAPDGTRAHGPATKDKAGDLQPGKPLSISASAWLDKNQPVAQMTWAPGFPTLIHDRLVAEGGWFDQEGANCYNLYKPPTIKHGDPSHVGPWLDHIRKVYPDEADHIIKWLAHRVQHPEIKINHNIVLGGNPGVGKDTLLAPAVEAVGPWNCAEVTPEMLFGRFNGFLKSVILRLSEARDMGDVNKFQLYERMKTMGAAPPDVLRVDEKNLREHSIMNCVGVIITTNYKTDGIYLPADDRRHYVCWSDLTQADFDDGYFKTLWDWYKSGGFENVAAFLGTLDISGFDPKAPPLKTPAFWEIVDANRPTEESEIADVLDVIGNPPAITIDRLIASAGSDLGLFLKDRKNRKAVAHRIGAAGYSVVRNDQAKSGLWVVDSVRKAIYALTSLSVPQRFKAAQQVAAGALWDGISQTWKARAPSYA
jgi:Primase C terminal 2 (PriCT-2)/Bifunctional DNA primase/polymerase, N-terminal/Family of unknown function (DUF5906)